MASVADLRQAGFSERHLSGRWVEGTLDSPREEPPERQREPRVIQHRRDVPDDGEPRLCSECPRELERDQRWTCGPAHAEARRRHLVQFRRAVATVSPFEHGITWKIVASVCDQASYFSALEQCAAEERRLAQQPASYLIRGSALDGSPSRWVSSGYELKLRYADDPIPKEILSCRYEDELRRNDHCKQKAIEPSRDDDVVLALEDDRPKSEETILRFGGRGKRVKSPLRKALRYGKSLAVRVDGVLHRLAHFGLVPTTLCRSVQFTSLASRPDQENAVEIDCEQCMRLEHRRADVVRLVIVDEITSEIPEPAIAA